MPGVTERTSNRRTRWSIDANDHVSGPRVVAGWSAPGRRHQRGNGSGSDYNRRCRD